MARVPLSFVGRVKGGPARGGLGRTIRFYTDDTLAVAKTVNRRETGAGAQPVPMIPNAGIPRALAANRAAGDAFVTVAIGQTGFFNVGDLVPIYNAVQGTVYRVIIAINAGTGQLDLDSALGVAFTVANGTMVNATDMEGHVFGWVDDGTATWMQVTELGSSRVLAPVKVASAAPALVVAVQEEGGVVNSRATINFIGRSVTAADDGANNRVNVTIGIAGTEAAPAPEVIGDTDTGLWGEGANILSIVGGGKRMSRFIGGTTLVNYPQLQANVTGGAAVLGGAGSDTNVGVDVYTQGAGGFRVVHGGARVGLNVPSVASSINYAELLPVASGGAVVAQAAGGDSNIELHVRGKGSFGVVVANNYTDFLWIVGGTGSTTLSGVGGSANVAVVVQGKGTGSVQLVVASAGGAVVIGRTAQDYFTSTAATGTVDWTAVGASAAININLVPKGSGTLQYAGTEVSKVTHAHAAGTFSAEDASTSGTSRDITGIPAGVRRITIVLVDVSEAASLAQLALQIGDSGGIETSGYTSTFGHGVPGGAPAFQGQATDTTYWQLTGTPTAAELMSGIWTLINENGNTWVIHGHGGGTGSASDFVVGRKTLSGTLDRVRLTTITGAGTFDAGVWRVLYE